MLIVAGVLLVLGWIWYAPIRQSLLYDEIYLNSGLRAHAMWREAREIAIGLRGWRPEDVKTAMFNGKSELAWFIDKGPPGEAFDESFGPRYAATLRIITNQDPGSTKELWQKWWAEHHSETTAQWILQGFKDHGLDISVPLSRDTKIQLLRVIGRAQLEYLSNDPPIRLTVPHHIRFNALRLLAEDGFGYGAARITPSEIGADLSGELLEGLLSLESFQAAADFPPVLKPSSSHVYTTPWIHRPWFPWLVLGSATILIALGWSGLKRLKRPDAGVSSMG